jgi:serine/threonine-protein kinase
VDFSPGAVIADKFRIEAELGHGGMGFVVRARHLVLDSVVAIKFLRRTISTHPEAVRRLVREAQAATRITSEHVARVLDVATLPNGDPYIVMEYLQGRDLDQVVESSGPISVELAIDYILQASVAIAEAHALGIVHRDLKPANLFLTSRSDGRPFIKVLDFGISKVQPFSSPATPEITVTNTSALMGSPLYISPEQMRSAKKVTPSADIWSLGVILYELVTGALPFDGPSIPAVCAAVATAPPAPLSVHKPGLPFGFEAVVLRCLEKAPEARYPDIAALAAALQPFASVASYPTLQSIHGIAREIPQPLMVSRAPESTRRRGETGPHRPVAAGITSSAFESGLALARTTLGRRFIAAATGVLAALSVVLFALLLSPRPSRSHDVSFRVDPASSPPDPSPSASDAPPTTGVEPVDAPSGSAAPAAADSVKPSRRDRPLARPAGRPGAPNAPANRPRKYGGRE